MRTKIQPSTICDNYNVSESLLDQNMSHWVSIGEFGKHLPWPPAVEILCNFGRFSPPLSKWKYLERSLLILIKITSNMDK